MLDEKDFQRIDELISRRIGIVMENEVMPKFNLLADGIADIQEKLVPAAAWMTWRTMCGSSRA